MTGSNRGTASQTVPVDVRPLVRADKPEWQILWSQYLAFYATALPDRVFDLTFERLLSDDPWTPSGFVASTGSKPVGLVHYLYHAHCRREEPVCYLQDLFTAQDARGGGVGRALIEAVYAKADLDGAPNVYWMTQAHNQEARMLYDQIGTLTSFVKYQR